MRRNEFVDGNSGLTYGAAQGSNSQLLVHGNDATLIAAPKDDVAAFLADCCEPESLENSHRLSARNARQFSH